MSSEATLSPAADSSPAVLARARDLVTPGLRASIAGLDDHLRLPSEYHFGWIEPDGTPVDGAGGGKAVRPALAVLGAEAVGADATVAVPGAIAMELIHNFSLVHDDIMDGDRTRRHRPTVWDVYGVGDAIISGDALHTLAFQVLLDSGSPHVVGALGCLAAATAAMITGQAQDTALDRRPDGTLAECLEMEHNKTAALLGGSIAIGAVLGGGDPTTVSALERFGFELGLSFQAIDDVLGIWGDPAVTGKPVGNDLREHKKSVPVMLAFEAGGELADDLRDAFRTDTDPATVARLAERLDAAGLRRQTEQLAADHLAAAVAALDAVELPSSPRGELIELAGFVVNRKH